MYISATLPGCCYPRAPSKQWATDTSLHGEEQDEEEFRRLVEAVGIAQQRSTGRDDLEAGLSMWLFLNKLPRDDPILTPYIYRLQMTRDLRIRSESGLRRTRGTMFLGCSHRYQTSLEPCSIVLRHRRIPRPCRTRECVQRARLITTIQVVWHLRAHTMVDTSSSTSDPVVPLAFAFALSFTVASACTSSVACFTQNYKVSLSVAATVS